MNPVIYGEKIVFPEFLKKITYPRGSIGRSGVGMNSHHWLRRALECSSRPNTSQRCLSKFTGQPLDIAQNDVKDSKEAINTVKIARKLIPLRSFGCQGVRSVKIG
jgi:hypothetical protein